MPALAAAQDPGEALKLCAEQPTDELKLACFEAVAAAYGDREETPEPAPVVPTADASPDPQPQAPEADAAPEPQPQALPAARPAPAASAQEAASGEEDEVLRYRVLRVTRTPGLRLLTFETESGAVWQQTGSRRFYYPTDGAFDIEIRRGMMGDQQLRVAGSGRMTRVKRID